MIALLIPIIVPIVIYFIVCTIVCTIASIIAKKDLDKRGLKVEKRVRHRRRTYNDGFGKYTVDIEDEEYVIVPKDKSK